MFGADGGVPTYQQGPSTGVLIFLSFLIICILIGMYIFLVEGTWRGTLNKTITGSLDAVNREPAKK